jgi:hypothetical protein
MRLYCVVFSRVRRVLSLELLWMRQMHSGGAVFFVDIGN